MSSSGADSIRRACISLFRLLSSTRLASTRAFLESYSDRLILHVIIVRARTKNQGDCESFRRLKLSVATSGTVNWRPGSESSSGSAARNRNETVPFPYGPWAHHL